MYKLHDDGVTILSTHVDDIMFTTTKAGEKEFLDIIGDLPLGSLEEEEFVYCGLRYEQDERAKLTRVGGAHRTEGLEEVKVPEVNQMCDPTEYRSSKGKLAYLIQSLRPDLASELKEISCGNGSERARHGAQEMNKLIRKVKSDGAREIVYPAMLTGETFQEKMAALEQCTIFVMTDASPSGQTGFITVLLGGDFQVEAQKHPCALMDRNITKVPKDGHGSFRPETRGFYVSLACAMRLQTDMERIFKKRIPITIGTDSQSLLSRLRSENTLRECENEGFQEMEPPLTSFWRQQSSVAFVSDYGNLSDLMTKTKNTNKTRKIQKLQEIMNGEFKLEKGDFRKERRQERNV